MVLRNYIKEDAAIICKWLRTEEELYRWSADRFNKFPLLETDINNNYMPQIETRRFIPLTAVDEKENLLGHFIIRYPREDVDSTEVLDGVCLPDIESCLIRSLLSSYY